MTDHRCLAIVDLLSGADEVTVLLGLGDLLSAHWPVMAQDTCAEEAPIAMSTEYH